MSDTIDESFIGRFRKPEGGTVALSDKTREFILSRIRPLMGRLFDDLSAGEDKSVELVKKTICALLARELASGKISEDEFWTFVKYEHLFNKETGFQAESDRGPSVVLRYGKARTPPVILWRDGTWGWTALLGEADVMFGMELLNAGRAMADPTPYIMRIDAMNRAQEPSPTQASKSSGCFIATVCYGDFESPEVVSLRLFRDRCLLPTRWGSAFVRFYYAVAPRLAATLADHHRLSGVVRRLLLNPLVRVVRVLCLRGE